MVIVIVEKNCKCNGDKCEGDGGGGDGGGDNCDDSFKLNKVCEGVNCELNAVLSIKDCKCSDIETVIDFKGVVGNKLTFGGNLFKGASSPNTNFKIIELIHYLVIKNCLLVSFHMILL
jgi:hypothetical protein